jgi:hypothetical protein
MEAFVFSVLKDPTVVIGKTTLSSCISQHFVEILEIM